MEPERRRRFVAAVVVGLVLLVGALFVTRRGGSPDGRAAAGCIAEMADRELAEREGASDAARRADPPASGAAFDEGSAREPDMITGGEVERTVSPAAAGRASTSAGGPGIETRLLDVRALFRGEPPRSRRVKMTQECGSRAVSDDAVLVRDGGLANVLVRVRDLPAAEGTGQGVEIVQDGCVYAPRVSGIVAGQSIAITSNDEFLHNVHTFAGEVSIFNKGQPSPSTFVKHSDELAVGGVPVRDAPIAFRCDVHPWMLAWVVVSTNPYFAVTGSDGRASLELPAGRHELEAWHEVYGARTAVVGEQDTSIAFEFP